MKGSVLSRARMGGLMQADGGIPEDRKKLTVRLNRADVRLMREMYDAGWRVSRIARIFGLSQGSHAYNICRRRVYPGI